MISCSRSGVPLRPTRGRQPIVLQSHTKTPKTKQKKPNKNKPQPLGLGSCDSDVLNITDYEHTQQINF